MALRKITVFTYLPNETAAVPVVPRCRCRHREFLVWSEVHGARQRSAGGPHRFTHQTEPPEVTSNGGIYGTFRDASPDYWGKLIIATEAKVPPEAISKLDFLLASNATRVGNLDFRLSPDDPEPDLKPPPFQPIAGCHSRRLLSLQSLVIRGN
jgi:serine/threonine-protein kinase HipA